ncbi:MAG: hypothetical protein IJV01_01295 [Bacteroidales bacterium]|nr:hypothetical protein [Bacteroidales bacterium]
MKTRLCLAVFCAFFCLGARAAIMEIPLADIAKKGKAFKSVTVVPGVDRAGNALFLDGETLFVGAGSTVYRFDVREPRNPKLLAECRIKGKCRQITGGKGYVYVASRETGLWVLDARQPDSLSLLTRYDPVELATGLDLAGDVLFVSLRQNGVEFVDVTDPAHPQHITLIKTSESQSNCYQDGWLYSGDWGRGEITVIDAHDCAQLHVAHICKLQGNGDGVRKQGQLLFAATGHHGRNNGRSTEENYGNGHGLEIFDCSDPTQPERLSRIDFPKLYMRGSDYWTPRPSGDGKTVFVADTFNGLYAIDCSDPRKPAILGRIILPDKSLPVPKTSDKKYLETPAPGRPVTSVAVGKGVVYFTAQNLGLAVAVCKRARPERIDKGSVPLNPGFRDPYDTPVDSHFTAWRPEARGQVRSVAVMGDRLAVACGEAGFYLLEEGADGRLVPCYHRAGFAGDVRVRDGRIYVAEGLDGLGVYGPARSGRAALGQGTPGLKELSHYRVRGPGGEKLCLWVWTPNSRHVVATDRTSGYYVLDNSIFPEFRLYFIFNGGCPGWDRYLPSEAASNGLWPFSVANQGYRWIDLSMGDPPYVSTIDRNNRPSLTNGVTNYRNGLFLGSFPGELRFIDPERAFSGERWPGVKGDFAGIPAWDGGSRVALTARIAREVRLVDMSDERHPVVLWKESVASNPDLAVFWKGRLVVPCGYQGLLLEK